MSNRNTMPGRVPPDLEDRVDKMIQIWEKIGPEKVMGDLSLQAVRDKLSARQRVKDARLMAISAEKDARIQLRVEDKETSDMTVQTLQAASMLFGSDSPEYKLAGGTPLSERGRRRNNRKASGDTPPAAQA